MNLLQNSSEEMITEDEIEEIFEDYQDDYSLNRSEFIKAVTKTTIM